MSVMKLLEDRRIPTPCVSNHASNLLELEGGDLFCTWFGGSMEGTADVSIYLARLPVGAADWSPPVRMSADPERSEQNPALFAHPSGELWLLYTAQDKADQGTAIVRRRRSADGGLSWGPVEQLFGEAGTFIRHAPVINPDGLLLLPVWKSSMRNAFGDDWSLVKVSADGGRSWETVEVPGSRGSVHMNILAGARVAFFRRRQADRIFRSLSDDGGLTWSVPEPTPLPNNNASIQARLLSDGRIVLAFNDIAAAGRPGESPVPPWIKDRAGFLAACEITGEAAVWGVPRHPLVIATSSDLGASFRRELTLEDDGDRLPQHAAGGAFRGDYSYPSILERRDGRIEVSYSYLRDHIKHATLSVGT